MTLDLGGSLNATDLFAGLGNVPGPTATTPGVHVVQISGVLNIGIATSDSGNNTVISLTTGTTRVDGPAFSSHLATSEVTPTVRTAGQAALPAAAVPGTQTVLARVITGNATSVGNFAAITVCQSFHDSVCDPPVIVPVQQPPAHEAPHPVPAPPVVTTRSVTPAAPLTADPMLPDQSVGKGTLPFTGANSSTLTGLGAVLLAAGVALCRRRKGVAGRRRTFSSED